MNKKMSKLNRFFLVLSIMICVLFVSIIGYLTIIYNKYELDTTKLTSLNNGIRVYSATGNDNTLYNTNRSIIELETLPEYVKNAFIDTEDKRFYSHNGYDLRRIIKSLFVNITSQSKSQGASTISQQLVKNAILSNEKTYSRKIQEIILSIKMEKQFSKDEILEMYLNTIYFGSNAYGIENASKIYFNKSAKDLTINEACCLAGIIKSPNHYSPKSNYNNSIERKNLVAKNMLNTGNISQSDYENILNTSIVVTNEKDNDTSYEKEAIFEACNLLNMNERDLINSKYEIITFKDDNLQNQVKISNSNIISTAENQTNTSLDGLSIVANTNGHVLAYYSNSNYNLHNLRRQPASTLKPLAVYLPCFKHNILSPASALLDEEINYNGFAPQNADKRYHGYVTCRQALSNSLNIPAVKALDYLGLKKSKETLDDLGVNISNSDFNLSLALGALKNGINMLDLLGAYNTLANSGNYSKLCFVNKIIDEHGNIIYSHDNYSIKVVDEESCFLVTDILKDCAKTGTAQRLNSLNLHIASKTGTASTEKGNTDLYNIAYTTKHCMLTWIADINKNTLPSTLLSSSQPTDVNKAICEYIYHNNPPPDFAIPSNIERIGYDIIEYENNHVLVQPKHKLERYIAYDYFKKENTPKFAFNDEPFNLNVDIDKNGSILSFDAKRYNSYNIYKQTTKGVTLLETVREKNGQILIEDNDVFIYDTIEYFITDSSDALISDIKKIRPKDYLITLLNNEVLSSKKKWLV